MHTASVKEISDERQDKAMLEEPSKPFDYADLKVLCPFCTYPVPPPELMMVDGGEVKCPKCLNTFVPKLKGSSLQQGAGDGS